MINDLFYRDDPEYNIILFLFLQTNSKAEVLTELEDAKSSLKKLEESEDSQKSILNGLQESIKERDRNINRLKDQIKYYVAFAENSFKSQPNDDDKSVEIQDGNSLEKLMKDLSEANEEVRSLRSHNLELKSQLEVIASQTRENSSLGNTTENGLENGHDHRLSSSSSSSSAMSSSLDSQEVSQDIPIINGQSVNPELSPSMSKELAMKKIEQKLKQAMQRIADLSSEKEQLEHIVIRLQDETDTVGEYITIYQYQRAQQKAQLHEKEQQLHSVAQDREELKQKLAQLQGLLTRYLGKANVEEPQENSTSDTGNCFFITSKLLVIR